MKRDMRVHIGCAQANCLFWKWVLDSYQVATWLVSNCNFDGIHLLNWYQPSCNCIPSKLQLNIIHVATACVFNCNSIWDLVQLQLNTYSIAKSIRIQLQLNTIQVATEYRKLNTYSVANQYEVNCNWIHQPNTYWVATEHQRSCNFDGINNNNVYTKVGEFKAYAPTMSNNNSQEITIFRDPPHSKRRLGFERFW